MLGNSFHDTSEISELFVWNPDEQDQQIPVTTFLNNIHSALQHPEKIRGMILVDAPINDRTIGPLIELIFASPLRSINFKETPLSDNVHKELHFALLKHNSLERVTGIHLTPGLKNHLVQNQKTNLALFLIDTAFSKLLDELDQQHLDHSALIKHKQYFYTLLNNHHQSLSENLRNRLLDRFNRLWVDICMRLDLENDTIEYTGRLFNSPTFGKGEQGSENIKELHAELGNYLFSLAGKKEIIPSKKLSLLEQSVRHLEQANSNLLPLVKPLLSKAYTDMGEILNNTPETQAFQFKRQNVLGLEKIDSPDKTAKKGRKKPRK